MVSTYNRSVFSVACIGAVVTVSAGVLSGCHKPPAPPPPTAASVAKPAAATVHAQSLPARQPGLWSVTISEDRSADAPQVQQVCLDAVTDINLGVLDNELSGQRCKTTVSHTADGGWGLVAECDMGSGGVYEYSGQITGDYTQDYTKKIRLQVTGAALPQMDRVTNYTVLAKHVGACAADQQPGDVISDGAKMNLFDMAGVPREKKASAASSAPPPAAGD